MTTRRVRPIDTTRALPGTPLRRYLDHLDQVLADSALDLGAAPAARDMLHATLRQWARTVDQRTVEAVALVAGIDGLAARVHLPLPGPAAAGVPAGDMTRTVAVRHLREHSWLVPHLPPPRTGPTLYRAATGQPFGAHQGAHQPPATGRPS